MQRQGAPFSLQPRARRWVVGGAIAMAAIAALALGATIWLAQRALGAAAELLIRGEAETRVAAVASDIRELGATDEVMATVLDRHRAAGVRYVAILDDADVRVSAGQAQLEAVDARPGDLTKGRGIVRMVGALPPSFDTAVRGPHELDVTPPPPGPPRGPPPGPGPGGPPGRRHPSDVVIELEPQIAIQLQRDVDRTSIVAGVAGVVLLAFALAWSRSLVRLDAVERQAERERRLVALGRMSSVMAHELKNPLASLKGHAQLLAEQLEHDDKAREKADRIVREAERLEALTKSLLEFVRDGAVDRRATPPAELLEDALCDLPGDRIELKLSDAPDRVDVDRARMARAIHNLIENALLASPEGSAVDVSVRKQERDVTIEVRDHGQGLGKEPIFEPFVTTRVRGTGLGLPIARRIAEQHGGTLTGETHPEGGAVFRIRLPGAARSA